MNVNSGRRQSISWALREHATEPVEETIGKGKRIAAAALLLPLVAVAAFLAGLLSGGEPRVSGNIGRAEKAALRRALRRRLADLVGRGTGFRLSSVLPFAWQRVYAVGAMEDVRGALPHLDADTARRLGSDRSDVLVIVREPDGLVRIDFGTDYSLVSADAAGLAGPDILVSAIRIAGVRHLHLAAADAPPAAAP